MKSILVKPLLIMLLSGIFGISYAQQKISRYKSADGKILMFKDHYFEYTEVSSPDYGRFTLKGTFKQQNDSLILFVGNSAKGDTCTFITTGLSPIAIDTMARIVISVYDTWGFPLDRPLFIVKDSANNAVLTTSSGKAPFNFTLYKTKNLSSILVTAQGYQYINVPVKSFYGKDVAINVQLSAIGAITGKRPANIVYKVLSFTKDYFTLQRLETGFITTFRRSD